MKDSMSILETRHPMSKANIDIVVVASIFEVNFANVNTALWQKGQQPD
jgi:hypothetical protein